MQKTLAELAKIVQGEVKGDPDVIIRGFNGVEDAKEGDLTFVSHPKYYAMAEGTKASAIIASRGFKLTHRNILYVDNPSLAFDRILSDLEKECGLRISGVHPTAVIEKGALLGKDVSVGAYAVIGAKAQIGNNTIVHSGVFIGPETKVGEKCIIYPNATIRERNFIGNRVIIHSGAVIGADGFGYVQTGGKHQKLAQIGIVVIEDDVEIGANVTIDRARFDKTFVGRGTKIDNLVHIAHNCRIEENCIIIAQVGISGSVVVGKNSILAGQAGVTGHLHIGEGSIVTAQTAVMKSLPPKSKVSGSPARPHLEHMRSLAYVEHMPEYVKRIEALEKEISMLKKKNRSDGQIRKTKNNKKRN